jgi:prophage DNA circulation protein
MTVAEKIQYAKKADREGRDLLIRDSNKLVAMAVLESPKITVQEIEHVAQSRNVSDEILRAVGNNREWTKNYSVVLALVNNPKTPLGIAMNYLPRIKKQDLVILTKNRNIASGLRSAASRLLKAAGSQG